ncbi:MAG: hypothetical protein Q8J80_07755 [Gallionella sp.]|nr:hypothetical protein [Gallionella sp.]
MIHKEITSVDHTYALEKFLQAERMLCEGLGDIKERLRDAYLCFHVLHQDDIPDELKEEFQWVINRLTSKPPLVPLFSDKVCSGRVEQTLHLMRRKTAGEIADRIRYLCRRLSEMVENDSKGKAQ